MKEYPEQERPRERMEMLGASQLSDRELLAILLATGSREYSALELADQILRKQQGLQNLQDLALDELMQQKGIGIAKASTIAAAVELGKRIWASASEYRPVISCSADAAKILTGRFRGLDREHFMVMLLNQKKALISVETISIGTLNASLAHPREVFKQAIKRSASALILVHNHPSGSAMPSVADINRTKSIRSALKACEMSLVDHVVIGSRNYYSFSDETLVDV